MKMLQLLTGSQWVMTQHNYSIKTSSLLKRPDDPMHHLSTAGLSTGNITAVLFTVQAISVSDTAILWLE